MKKWLPLFTSNFLQVFNDNFLKNLICFICIAWFAKGSEAIIIMEASAMLVLPYLFFSPLGGRLSKIYPKRKIIIVTKFIEIPIMILAVIGFWLESFYIIMIAMFLLGTQSSIFSPSKYGIIKDIDGDERISFGNGMIEMLTFIAVLIGTFIAGVISDVSENRIIIIGILVIITSIIGYYTSTLIRANEPEALSKSTESLNPIVFIVKSFKNARSIKGLNYVILGLSVFWFIGSMIHMTLIIHCPLTLGMTNTQTGMIMALTAIGIGSGCGLAGILSRNRVNLGLMPIGGFGLMLFTAIIFIYKPEGIWFILSLIMAAFFSGFFKIPMNAWIQENVKGRRIGDVIAYLNQSVFAFILLSSALFGLLGNYFSTWALFGFISLSTLIISVVTFIKIPYMFQEFIRFIFTIIGRFFFRISVTGLENLPKKEPAILVCNHLSWLDSFIIYTGIPRLVHYIIIKDFIDKMIFKKGFLAMSVPITQDVTKSEWISFLKECKKRLNEGFLLCIFPEGEMSRTGNINIFRKGVEQIAKTSNVPIIPMYMDNVQGSPLSFLHGNNTAIPFSFGLIQRRITLAIGEQQPPDTKSFHLRNNVLEIASNTFSNRISDKHNLIKEVVSFSKKHPKRILSSNSSSLTIDELTDKAFILSKNLNEIFSNENKALIILPDSPEKVIFYLALAISEKIAVITNETKPETIIEIAKQHSINCILTNKKRSHLFKDHLSVFETEELLEMNKTDKTPLNKTSLIKSINPDKTLAIIIKSELYNNQVIKLTHRDILSQLNAFKQIFNHNIREKMLFAINMNTCTGYIIKCWLTLTSNLCGFYLSDYKNTKLVCEKNKIEILATNNQNLNHYINSEDSCFISKFKYIITNFSSTNSSLKEILKKQYKIRLLECWGDFNLPIISMNFPDYVGRDVAGKLVKQFGDMTGSAGLPLPGITVKAVKSDNNSINCQANEIGILLVKGILSSNINPELKFHDEWFVTEKKGYLDENGFVFYVSLQS